jgi:hypothetical protein
MLKKKQTDEKRINPCEAEKNSYLSEFYIEESDEVC